MVTRWPRSTSQSYLSSDCSKFDRWVCGKFMQHLETCLLIAEANRVLCRLILLCFNRLFALDLQNEIHLLSRIFNYHCWRVNWVFGWEMRRSTEECSEIIVSKKPTCLRTSPCWMRKRVPKQGGGETRRVGPRNDVLTTCKEVTLLDGQPIIVVLSHRKYI